MIVNNEAYKTISFALSSVIKNNWNIGNNFFCYL